MIFNSLQFLLFFGAVTSLYFALEGRARIYLLLIASCWFYMAFVPIYISILFLTIIIDYTAGLWIARSAGFKRKLLLIVSIISNIGILGFFKYHNFFAENFNLLFDKVGVDFNVALTDFILPIGLSFHTFQALSYTIEVYRGNQKPERNFIIYSLYVMFYPQLVAGPIERPQNVLHQFYENHSFDRIRFRQGVLIILGGILKKVVIADRLALLVDPIYDSPWEYSSSAIAIATMLFAIQIYCDFSAYSEIAYGLAHLMGYKLMENFRTPYFSTSISEFWTRWHISLSTWFRDYLYIPLGGNRRSSGRTYFNLLFVFFVSGLWHGANWGYIIWGGLHGTYLVAAQLRKRIFPKFPQAPAAVNMLVVFGLSCFAWIFFRAESWSHAMSIFSGLRYGGLRLTGINYTELIFSVLLVALLFWKESKYNSYLPGTDKYFLKVTTLVVVTYFLGVFGQNQFIYFQF